MSFEWIDRARRTIGFRLTLWYAGAFILSNLVLFALAYALLASSLRQYDLSGVRAKLHELGARYEGAGLEGLKKDLATEESALQRKPFFIRIGGPRNTTVFMRIPDEWADFDLSPLEHAAVGDPEEVLQLPAKGDESRLEILSMRLPNGGLLQVGKSTEERDSFLERFRSIVAGVMIPVVLLGVSGGAVLAYRALRPIRQLIRTVRVIESGTMEARVPTFLTGDELDELGQLFNRMLDRIAALIQGMRGALDSVAHDLRTPMTRLRGIAEVALRSDTGPDSCRETLADCVEEADQLLTMLNTLMDISEAETGALKLNLEAMNIARLMEGAVNLYQEVAEEKGVTVSIIAPKELWLTADRNRMRQVLANLLDNAIKYTPSGGRIELSAHQQQDTVVLNVKDTGIGLTPDELPKVWDRLYRGEASRSERGLGLGLSLVKAVVHAHRGHVEVSSAPGVGSVFTVVLPIPPANPRLSLSA